MRVLALSSHDESGAHKDSYCIYVMDCDSDESAIFTI